jgi:soluble lytic murein transglycosylase-like protein
MMSTGLNQFLISSGESYGLRCTVEPSTDERRDPTKSIPAGVRFLSDLLRKLGSEDGMIVAYNKGAGGAQKYLKKNGSFAGVDYLTHIRARQQKYLHLDA